MRKISGIHEEINRALADCHVRTGSAATRIYLGRIQMGQLMKWAKDNAYISDTTMRDGDDRPEVMGLPVYEVDDEDHCAVL